MLELNLALYGVYSNCIFFVGYCRLCVENLENALGSRNAGNNLIVELAQALNRLPEHSDVSAERKKCTDRNAFNAHNLDADPVHGKNAETPRKVDNRKVSVCPAAGVYKTVAVFISKLPESAVSFFFSKKTLHNFYAGKVFADESAHIRALL